MKQFIVFKNQQGEIVQTVEGDNLEEWLDKVKSSPSWRQDLTHEIIDQAEVIEGV